MPSVLHSAFAALFSSSLTRISMVVVRAAWFIYFSLVVRITWAARWPAGDAGQKPCCNFLATKKAAGLLRLGFGNYGVADRLLDMRKGKDVRVIQANLRRNAALLPVLHALDAVSQAGCNLGGAAQPIYQVFVRKHLFSSSWLRMPVLNTMFNRSVNAVCNTICLVRPIISRMHIQMERLYRAAKEMRGIDTQSELARALNQSQQTVNNWETRGISNPGLLRAQAAIGCSATWLETGEGAMAPEAVQPNDVLALVPGAMRVRVTGDGDPSFVPVMKVKIKVQAGITGFQIEPEYYDGETLDVPSKWVQREGLARENLLGIVVRGESMEPALYDGDTVIVDTGDTKLVDGSVYVVNYEGEAVVKRMIRDAGQWWLASDNADQREIPSQIMQRC